jgi:hypothetical protein
VLLKKAVASFSKISLITMKRYFKTPTRLWYSNGMMINERRIGNDSDGSRGGLMKVLSRNFPEGKKKTTKHLCDSPYPE